MKFFEKSTYIIEIESNSLGIDMKIYDIIFCENIKNLNPSYEILSIFKT